MTRTPPAVGRCSSQLLAHNGVEPRGGQGDRRKGPRRRRFNHDPTASDEIQRHRTARIETPARPIHIDEADGESANAVVETAEGERQAPCRIVAERDGGRRAARRDEEFNGLRQRWPPTKGMRATCDPSAPPARSRQLAYLDPSE